MFSAARLSVLTPVLFWHVVQKVWFGHFPTVPNHERQNVKIKKHLHIVTFCIEMSVTQCGRCCCVFTGLSVIEVSVSAGGDLFFLLCSHGDAPCSCYRHHFLYSGGEKKCCCKPELLHFLFFFFLFLPQETTKPDNSRNGNASRSCLLCVLCYMVQVQSTAKLKPFSTWRGK